MINSLALYPAYYDIHPRWFEDIEERLAEKELVHYASKLLEQGLQDERELEKALRKAIIALNAAHLPATRHFRKVFVSVGHDIKNDWLVSNLGLRLIMMNADVSNPVVARLQIEILSGKFA